MAEDGRTRVLWLAKGLGPGGTERLLVSHARVGDHARFAYRAAYLRPDKVHLIPELASYGVPATCLDGANPYDLRWAVRLRRLLRDERVEVLHVHSPFVAAVARVVARTVRPRPRVVYTEHNSWDSYGRGTRWANRLTYGLDDAHVAVSDQVLASVPPRERRGLRALVHGIDVEGVRELLAERDAVRAELGVTAEQVLVGIVANFRAAKAYPDLLAAAREVTAKHPQVRFVSVGQGPLADATRAERDRLGLTDEQFRFLGYRADATRVMAGLDVFTLSSRFEGLPVTLMEARALGLPVVVTRVGGLATHVRDGVDGVLVEPGRPAELAAALARVATDDALRARLGAASAAAAGPFDARLSVTQLEASYAPVADS